MSQNGPNMLGLLMRFLAIFFKMGISYFLFSHVFLILYEC